MGWPNDKKENFPNMWISKWSLLTPGLGVYFTYASNDSRKAPKEMLHWHLPSLKVISHCFEEILWKQINLSLLFVYLRDRELPATDDSQNVPNRWRSNSEMKGLNPSPDVCQEPHHFTRPHHLPGRALGCRNQKKEQSLHSWDTSQLESYPKPN